MLLYINVASAWPQFRGGSQLQRFCIVFEECAYYVDTFELVLEYLNGMEHWYGFLEHSTQTDILTFGSG